MSKETTKQITVRFNLSDWVQILGEAEDEGIKPVQYIRSTILKRLSGTLVDVKSIDAYLRQRERQPPQQPKTTLGGLPAETRANKNPLGGLTARRPRAN